MIDEVLLREEPLLKRYWSLRDKGDHKSARRYLLTNEPSIHAILHIDQDVSSRCHLAIRFQDLYMMGNGGDARRIMPVMAAPISLDTRRSNTELWREREFVRVLELATGTWPSSSGGVSNCIRDVVDGLESVRWTVLAENAHDLELILSQFQIERNVESLLMLPLWGFDGLEPMHDFNGTLPDSTLALRVFSTTPSRIRIFISILHRLIDACIATPHNLPSPIPITIAVHTKTDLAAATHAFVEYYRFFRKCDYGAVWSHPEVWKCWIGRWTEAIKGGELEWPTVDDMREAMDYFKRTLFCLTVAFPDPMPDVIQSSHHAIGSIYGVVGKMITGKPFLFGITVFSGESILATGAQVNPPLHQHIILSSLHSPASSPL
ncbi:hypothetical protein BC829DRAFT_280848 [Chytridium lagenaria]|nr:hypothetical protein BC829DRAFT_280848 [Chytridium lagenaria]